MKYIYFLLFISVPLLSAPVIEEPEIPEVEVNTAQLIKAYNLYDTNNIPETITILKNELTKTTDESKKSEVNFLLGICYFELQNWDEALRYFAASKSMPGIEDYLQHFKALAYYKTSKFEEALNLNNQIISKYPDSRFLNISLINKFLCLSALKKDKEADKFFKVANIERKIGKIQDKLLASEILYNYATLNKDLKRKLIAINYFKKLLMEYPSSPFADSAQSELTNFNYNFTNNELINLARNASKHQLYAKSENYMKTLESNGIPPQILSQFKASLALKKGDWDTVVKYLSNESTDGLTNELLFNIAKAYIKLGNYSFARYYLNKIIERGRPFKSVISALDTSARLYSIEGNYKTAIELHEKILFLTKNYETIIESKFQIAWNYYIDSNFNFAINSWEELQKIMKADDTTKAMVLYWLARTYALLGKFDKSDELFYQVIKSYPLNYYAFQSENRLLEISPINADKISKIEEEIYKALSNGEVEECKNLTLDKLVESVGEREKLIINKLTILTKLGLYQFASNELYRIHISTKNKNVLLETAKIYNCLGDYFHSQFIVNIYFRDKLEALLSSQNLIFWRLAYPKAYSGLISRISSHYSLNPYLIYALIKAESSFNPAIVSAANAIGLMQITPNTGQQIASKLNDKEFSLEDLYDPMTNITFGVWYIDSLITSFSGNTILAIPSYNGGPHNVKKWLRQFGSLKVDEFVETIPFNETKNYVKKVIKNFGVYLVLYSNTKTPLKLSQSFIKENNSANSFLKQATGDENSEDWNQYENADDLRKKINYRKEIFSKDRITTIQNNKAYILNKKTTKKSLRSLGSKGLNNQY